MKLIQLDYRNWKIIVSQTETNWTITCCPPEGEPLNDGRLYADCQFACAEAKTFIDRTVLRCKVASLMDGWLEAGQISSEQHDQADLLIAALVKISISDHFEFVQTQQLQPPGNQPDSLP